MTDCEIRILEQAKQELQSNNERLQRQHNDRNSIVNGLILYSICISVAVVVSLFQTELWKTQYQDLKKELITLDYAGYNHTNGNWELKK